MLVAMKLILRWLLLAAALLLLANLKLGVTVADLMKQPVTVADPAPKSPAKPKKAKKSKVLVNFDVKTALTNLR